MTGEPGTGFLFCNHLTSHQLYICEQCGALVIDTLRHELWHEYQNEKGGIE